MVKDSPAYDLFPALEDICNSVLAIGRYIEGVDLESFLTDGEKQDAVLRRLTVLGEAVKRLPVEYRAQHPDIPWKEMAGVRDVLVHDYDQINLHMVWEIVRHDLPPLVGRLRALLEEAR